MTLFTDRPMTRFSIISATGRAISATLLSFALAADVQAQLATPIGVRTSDNPVAPQAGVASRTKYEMPGRIALGVGGAVAGAFGGLLLGANVIYRGGCACEDPGLAEAVVGGAIGTVLGSAIMASIPDFGSTCGPAERIGRGVAGSLLGALGGGVLGAVAGGAGVLVGYMAGAGIGAGVMSAGCK